MIGLVVFHNLYSELYTPHLIDFNVVDERK